MNRKLLVTSLALCTFALGAWAQTSEEANAWLQKLAGIQDKAPFSLDIQIAMGAGPTPMPIGSIDGNLLQGDSKHMRMVMNMTPAPEAQGMPPMKFTVVADGTNMWTEVDMGGMRQVFKAGLEQSGHQAPGMMGGMGGNMDPLAQLQAMANMADFQVSSKEEGVVKLYGKLKEEAAAGLSQQMPGVDSVTIHIAEDTGFPIALFLGDEEQPFIKMSFVGLKFLKDGEVDQEAFSYTPPEGVPVMDAAAMRPQQGGQ